jgi:MoxR-like ATPase
MHSECALFWPYRQIERNENMAGIKVIKKAIEICREGGVTPFLWGHRGMGKSSLVRQLAEERGWGFVDLRCSQLEAADLRGLPCRDDDGRTHFLPPADLPVGDLTAEEANQLLGPENRSNAEERAAWLQRRRQLQTRRSEGILFLDELNRAADDVLHASFQLVLDRAVGEYVLPPGWSVVAAGNFAEGYSVNNFDDPAFLDRFAHLVLSTGQATAGEWVTWMRQTHGAAADDVLQFAMADLKHLYGNSKGGLGFTVQPSPRSWDAAVRVLSSVKAGSHIAATREVLAGLVGRDLATAFRRHHCPIEPAELLESSVRQLSDRLGKLDRQQLVGLMWGLVRLVEERIADPAACKVALDFATYLSERVGDRDLVLALCRSLAEKDPSISGSPELRAALVTNFRLARAVAQQRTEPAGFVDLLTLRHELHMMLADNAWCENPTS